MSGGTARELGAQLRSELAAVLRRQTDIATEVLDTNEVSLILMQAAVTIVRSVAASLAILAPGVDSAEAVYDAVIVAIVEKVGTGRADALSRVFAEIADGRS